MAEIAKETCISEAVEAPDISHIITEDDEPVDNIFSEKQQRLLAGSLNCSWKPGRPFVAFANVGLFYGIHLPPIVPDMFLSMDVKVAKDIWKKENRSYFVWEFGKPPEIAVEVVSNKKGGEASDKMGKYEHARVSYYIIFDPWYLIQKEKLRVYELTARGYIPKVGWRFAELELGIKLWDGVYEGMQDQWLRWCDSDGNLIPTAKESAEMAKADADAAIEKAEADANTAIEKAEADAETARLQAARLVEKLRSMGMDDKELANL